MIGSINNKETVFIIKGVFRDIPVNSEWLNNFACRTSISRWVFLIAFVVSSVVVTATVSFHSYKASRINPVDALKYE